MKMQDKDLYACDVLEVKEFRFICIFCLLGEPGLVCWSFENEQELQASNESLPCDNSVGQWQEESFGDSADLGLKFKVAGERPEIESFCGSWGWLSCIFKRFLEGDWSEVPGNV